MGERLAKEQPADADIVVGVPNSSLSAALGYARASGIPYEMGLIKSQYIARTFIQPTQALRERSVRMKLSPVKAVVAGKRIVLVDDSIVRGTTAIQLVQLLKDAGAKEVHLRIASPPLRFPCFYGIDIQTTRELMAANHSICEMRDLLGADSLAFLSVDGLEKSVGLQTDAPNGGLCVAYFTGVYPTKLDDYEKNFASRVVQASNQYCGGFSMSFDYKSAGVDVDAGNELVHRIAPVAKATQNQNVLGDLGGFAAAYRLPEITQPTLVSATDGVGTKLLLALQCDQHDTIGIDLVAMVANDLIADGAKRYFSSITWLVINWMSIKSKRSLKASPMVVKWRACP